MSTLNIKQVPERLVKRLKERAAANHRSLNGEVIACLEDLLEGHRIDPDGFLAEARILRTRVTDFRLTDDFLREARNEGRP